MASPTADWGETFAARPEDATYWGPPPTPERRAELLAALPGSVAGRLADLLDGRIVSGAERYDALPACFREIGYPELDGNPARIPIDPTPEWRALLELSTALPRILPSWSAAPTDTWNLRRWLGLDPPGRLERPLEDGGPPLWRIVASAKKRPWSVLQALPLPERIEAFCEGSLRAYRLPEPDLADLGAEDGLCTVGGLLRLGDPGRTVAPAMADFLVRWWRSPDVYRPLRLPEAARSVVLLAVAAADLPAAPAWDVLYPLGRDREHELLDRIPPERRVAAIEEDAGRLHPYYAEKALLRVLPRVPDARLVALLKQVGKGGGGHPKRVLADELRRLGEEHPAVGALLGAAPPPKPHALTFRAVPLPPAGEPLPELARQQVSMLDEDRHLYRWFTAHDARGRHVYDLSLFCWDDGPIYRAGTTTIVGRFVQGSAECDDATLADALDTALHRFRSGLETPPEPPEKSAKRRRPRPKKASR